MQIVELEQSYLDDIAAIEQQSYRTGWSRQLIANEFVNEYSVILGACDEEQLRGYCFSHIVLDECHILNVAVSPSHRRQGIASQLLMELLSRATHLGVKRAFLEVRAGNKAAQQMYDRFGFTLISLRKGYYADNSEDAMLLALDMHERNSAKRPRI